MSGVWYCIPSARPAAEAQRCVEAWRDMGYKVAVFQNGDHQPLDVDLQVFSEEYPGYAAAVNHTMRWAIAQHDAQWLVTGGDDVFPDPNKRARDIAAELTDQFNGTFGVMQPTGDGHGIETICGSPWIGREFCERVYGGNGPFYGGYTHCFLDNELQDVATKLDCFWQRPDLSHRHEHWTWSGKPMPEFLKEANSRAHWDKYQRLYLNRKAAGFPGHEPLPVAVPA